MHDSAVRRSVGRLTDKRVLFFSVSYKPEHAGIGPYAAATAERLAEEGADVAVVAGLPHYPSWRVASRDRWRLKREEIVDGLSVMRLRQVVPRRQTAVSRGLYELSFLLHGIVTRRTWQSADVIVAVVPSLAGATLAKIAAARHRVPLVLIVQDLMTASALQSGMAGGRLVSTMLGAFEAWLLRGAQAVGLVHDSLVHNCLRMGVDKQRLHVVPNWALHEAQASSAEAVPRADWASRYVVLHAGNMGFKQGLEVVVDAARLAHERGHDDVLFVLMGDGNRRDRLAQLVRGIPTIRIIDPVDRQDFPAVLAAADVALVTQRAEVHDMSVPSKLTAYFTAGRPVVCSASADGGTATEIRRSGGGLVVPPQNAEALLDAVLTLRASPPLAQSLGEAGRAYSSEYLSPQVGLERVVALVSAGLQTPA